MPDVVLYHSEKNWLVLVEAVTSHGPVDGKRHAELSRLFAASTAGGVCDRVSYSRNHDPAPTPHRVGNGSLGGRSALSSDPFQRRAVPRPLSASRHTRLRRRIPRRDPSASVSITGTPQARGCPHVAGWVRLFITAKRPINEGLPCCKCLVRNVAQTNCPASLFPPSDLSTCRLLDADAGIGALTWRISGPPRRRGRPAFPECGSGGARNRCTASGES